MNKTKQNHFSSRLIGNDSNIYNFSFAKNHLYSHYYNDLG